MNKWYYYSNLCYTPQTLNHCIKYKLLAIIIFSVENYNHAAKRNPEVCIKLTQHIIEICGIVDFFYLAYMEDEFFETLCDSVIATVIYLFRPKIHFNFWILRMDYSNIKTIFVRSNEGHSIFLDYISNPSTSSESNKSMLKKITVASKTYT